MQTERVEVMQTTRTGRKQGVDLRGSGLVPRSVAESPGWEAWAEAVEAGGRGEYARALAGLEAIRRCAIGNSVSETALRSLTLSTEASLLRQSGRHRQARARDGQALLTVAGHLDDPATGSIADFVPQRAATADALIGLAADNLGLLRFSASRRLLDRARTVLAPHLDPAAPEWSSPETDWHTALRCLLRWEWVSAELGLYSGNVSAGVAHARAGEGLLVDRAPVRHRLKTRLIAAAATAAAGDRAGATEAARAVVNRTRAAALMPLEWAALALLIGIGEAAPDEHERHRELAAALVGKGMPLTAQGAR